MAHVIATIYAFFIKINKEPKQPVCQSCERPVTNECGRCDPCCIDHTVKSATAFRKPIYAPHGIPACSDHNTAMTPRGKGRSEDYYCPVCKWEQEVRGTL